MAGMRLADALAVIISFTVISDMFVFRGAARSGLVVDTARLCG